MQAKRSTSASGRAHLRAEVQEATPQALLCDVLASGVAPSFATGGRLSGSRGVDPEGRDASSRGSDFVERQRARARELNRESEGAAKEKQRGDSRSVGRSVSSRGKSSSSASRSREPQASEAAGLRDWGNQRAGSVDNEWEY
jgi:hypothetical protein